MQYVILHFKILLGDFFSKNSNIFGLLLTIFGTRLNFDLEISISKQPIWTVSLILVLYKLFVCLLNLLRCFLPSLFCSFPILSSLFVYFLTCLSSSSRKTFHFQARSRRRRPNLALVFGVHFLLWYILLPMHVCFCCICSSSSILSQEIGWEECLQNDPFCVGWDVTP